MYPYFFAPRISKQSIYSVIAKIIREKGICKKIILLVSLILDPFQIESFEDWKRLFLCLIQVRLGPYMDRTPQSFFLHEKYFTIICLSHASLINPLRCKKDYISDPSSIFADWPIPSLSLSTQKLHYNTVLVVCYL